jgi:NAD(P)H-dependent flavin oxidoreductase YrpB (nitropropane dioxygenase family)
MRTPICADLGIEYPIFAFSHCRDVVVAVSKAGGMGVLGASTFSPEQLEAELKWIEAELGDVPYGVDVLVPARYVGAESGGRSRRDLVAEIPTVHKEFVDSLLDRHGVPRIPDDERRKSSGSVTHRGAKRLLEVAFAHRIRLVANALGPAPDFMIEGAHERAIAVAALVGSPQHAERQMSSGVDVVVAQGYEAGGHTGEISTMVLVPQVVDTVAPLPVLAAGGIADGRQVAAALALGAQGVWCGSVWLTTPEAETHPAVKEKMLRATSRDTLRSRSTTGKPARQLRSAWTDAWEAPENPDPLPMPLQGVLVSEARDRIDRAAEKSAGARELANYFVGQVVGQMNTPTTCRQVMLNLVEEYVDAVDRLTVVDGAHDDSEGMDG